MQEGRGQNENNMADKTPVRVVFNSSNVATGMAEFQTGETVPVANGGTGLSSIGSAGQVLKVNAAGSGLEFSGEGDLSITNLVAPSNADLNLRTSGTGGIILNDITISDNAISTNRSNDDFKINASGTGTVILENLKVGTSGSTVTTILDEDNLSSDSDTALATQQSIKAYVDSEVSAVSTTSISTGDSNVTVVDSGTGNVTIEVDGTDRLTTVAATTTTATGHSIVIGAGSNSAGGSIKFLEGTDNGTNGVTLLGPASTADVTVTLPSSAGTLALTSDITFTASSTDTLTNKTFDVEGTGNSISNIDVADLKSGVLDTDLTSVSGSDDTLASAKAIKTYVDAQVTAQDLDFATDDSTALNIDLDSETLQVSGGANITTSGSGNTITIALDTTLSGLSSVTSTAVVTNKISSADSTAVRLDDSLNVDGALDVGGGFTISNTTSVTSIVDEDAMGSDSATALATQQSIKAYVDTQDANIASDTLTLTNKTFDVEATGNSISNIDVADLKSGVLDTDLSSVSGSDDTLASAKAIKSYVDSQVTAQDLDIAADDSTAIAIDLDSEVLQVSGGAGITTSATGNTITVSLDTALTVNSLVSSDSSSINIKDGLDIDGTLTLASGTGVNNILDEDAMGSNSATSLATQQSIKAYADTKTALTGSTNNQITTVTGANAIQGESNLTFDGSTLAVTGAVTISGNLTVSGDTTSVSTTNTTVEDNILELNTGISQSLNDAGIIIERGTTGDNAAIIWDESADTFVLGTTQATAGDKSGGITIAAGSLKIASLEVDGVTITDNVITSNSSNANLDINANGSGTVVLENLSVAGDGATVTGILDEDDLSSDSDVKLATQQSIKAYADTKATLSGSTDNTIATVTGAHALQGEANLTFDGSTFAVTGGATISTTLGVTGASTLDGVTISDNKVSANASNSVLRLASSGTGDVEVDAGGDIILDADNADIILKDDGTEFGRFSRVSSDLVIKSATNNKDMLFKGNDGGATITALTLDMSEAGAATFNDVVILGTNKEIQFVDTNESIKSDGSKLIVKSGGTTFNLPTADGTDGQALLTDGAGTLSFGSVGDASASDDTNASALANKRITSTARAIDSFGETFQDSVLYYVCTNDHHLDTVNIQKVSLAHNDTGPFLTASGVASGTGSMTTFTADSSNNVIRLKAASTNAVGGNASYYKFGLGDNSTAATSGNIIVTQNTDVDSASEAITSFAHADFRGAKLFISINNDSKTEVTNMEGLVVHDGTNAYITTYNAVNTGNNTLATFTAAISGDNVVISGAGLEPNLRITVHAIMLKDTMTANAGTYGNTEAIAPVTVSSSATSFDTFAQKTTNGAVYYLVSKNAAEGHYAVNEILVAFGSDNITTANAGFVSTKGTNQIAVTSEIKDDTELTGDIKISSTSGASTTVSAYMIKLHAS